MIDYLFFQRPSPYWEQTKALRFEVFVDEQAVPKALEIDAHDASAQHLIAIHQNNVVGTLRLVFTANAKTAKLGRLAVKKSYRHQGIATHLIQHAQQYCKQQGVDKIELDAQIVAKKFYSQLGYQPIRSPFMDAGIPHIKMVKALI